MLLLFSFTHSTHNLIHTQQNVKIMIFPHKMNDERLGECRRGFVYHRNSQCCKRCVVLHRVRVRAHKHISVESINHNYDTNTRLMAKKISADIVFSEKVNSKLSINGVAMAVRDGGASSGHSDSRDSDSSCTRFFCSR